MEGQFSRGLKTLEVNMSLHQTNRKRLSERLAKVDGIVKKESFVLFKGGESSTRYCSDAETLFRQESFFNWAFGVEEPDCFGAVHVSTAKAILFVPRLPDHYGVWMGKLWTLDDFKLKYQTDSVMYVDEMHKFFEDRNPEMIYLLEGKNADSGKITEPANFEGIAAFKTDKSKIYNEVCELRVVKTPEEIEVIRYANEVSSEAHKKVMRAIRPGMKEYQMESLFLHHCYAEGGARHVCYTCICGTGDNSSILHYGHSGAPNSRTIEDGDMALFDMGCEYHCYCSDITCSFPVNGKFTADQKMIYNAVYAANQAVMQAAKPGVSWQNMHLLSERVMLTCLSEGGLLKGSIDDMMDARLGAVFMPHGLGHLMGCDVHDVGGYLSTCPPRSDKPGLKSLRTARTLLENMVLTVEPGCYFVDLLLDKALADPVQSRYLVADVIQRFRGFGGVRIEDDVLITEHGCENLTRVKRTVEEIAAHMATN